MPLFAVVGGRLGTALAGLCPWPLDAVVQFRQLLAQLGRASGGRLASNDSLPLHFAPLSIFLPLHPRALAYFIIMQHVKRNQTPPFPSFPSFSPSLFFPIILEKLAATWHI